MRFDQFYTKLFCRPLCLEAGARISYEQTLLAMMKSAQAPDLAAAQAAFELRKSDPTRAAKRAEGILEMRGSDTAIVHIDGAIDKHLSDLDLLCMNATDLRDVDKALAKIDGDSKIENVLLAFNSPGGGITGVPETAARIADLATRKNVFSYTETQLCSAAYWLASGTDQIFGTASAQVGSIGVYLALIDESRALDAMGIRVETIRDGKHKAAGASWKPLSEEDKAHFQKQVSQIGTMFRGAVNQKRPAVSVDTMQGQSFFGREALTAGLVDGIVSDLSGALRMF
jgi:protease-4